MKRVINYSAVLVVLLAAYAMPVGGSEIVNGSFEADGRITNITVKEPNGWDVNVPSEKFAGMVDNIYWVTDGNWGLTLYSKSYKTFVVDDNAFVWQDVYFSDANTIVFDVQLDTYPAYEWNPALRSAFVMMDGEIVWQSPKTGTDIRGEYMNQVIIPPGKDPGLHRLAIGIKADVNETSTFKYYTDWDNIRLGAPCNKLGDFNTDCIVDAADLAMLADVWLDNVEAGSIYNLSHNGDNGEVGIVNFYDFAVFANNWLKDGLQ